MEHLKSPMINYGQCQIKNSDVEGQCRISMIVPLKLSNFRVALAILISICTAFLFIVACSWSKKLTRIFFFTECVNVKQATHFWVLNDDKTCNIIRKVVLEGQISLLNRKLKYIYVEESNHFTPLEYQLHNYSNNQILRKGFEDIQDPQHALQQYGPCKIEIPIPSVFSYLLKELTAPFYILQYVTCVLWTIENYASLAIVMITVSILITTLNYILLTSSVMKLREMAKYKFQAKVYRPFSEPPILIDSQDIVPGDILIIESKQVVPCDSIILSGELMMNESSLTGETVPVAKFQLQKNDNIFSPSEDKRSCLFEGTKVILTKPTDHQYVLALVIRTGFCSFRGQIFRNVLYPKPQKFTFYKQAIKFLSGLALIILTIYFIELYRLIELEFTTAIIILRFGDAITWIIPPALPIFVSMCMTYSLLRLRRHHRIFGVESQKSLTAGQVNTVCFDKTGTLTTTSIQVYGYQTVENINDDLILSPTITQTHDKNSFIFQLFATCHGVVQIDDELLGDTLDVEMYNFSGHKISTSMDTNVKLSLTNKNNRLDVLKVNEFECHLQRMSVLVHNHQDGKFYIFCKGSPEQIQELSHPFSIPSNFKSQFDIITLQGLRVLGMACREVTKDNVKLLLDGDRSVMEKDLQFLGLLIMENKLKTDTTDIINELTQSGLDLKVISGDNGLTTIQCARECNIIDINQPMLLVDYCDKNQRLVLEEVDQQQEVGSANSFSFSEDTQTSKQNPTHEDIMKKLMKHLLLSSNTIKQSHLQKKLNKSVSLNQDNDVNQFVNNYGFAITGKAFDYFWAQSPQSSYIERKGSFAGFDEPLIDVNHFDINGDKTQQMVFTAIVLKAKIFARMRPEQKSQIIEQLQNQNRVVAMIGDGANDCAAIKQANVGISFAQTDASYAAPFSSQGYSISCVKYVLLDGRASLTNTIEVFQYYIVASVIKYFAAMLMATQGQNFSQLQMIYVNYVATLPFLGAICMSKPCDKLTNKIPLEDMAKLPNQLTIYFHIMMSGVGLISNYLYWQSQDWRSHVSTISTISNGQYIQEGQIQTTLFLCCTIYFQANLLSLYISTPFKSPIYRHKIIVPWWILMIAINLYFFLDHADWMKSLLQIWDLQGSDYGSYLVNQLFISVFVSSLMVVIHQFILKRFFPCNQPLLTKATKITQT